MTVMLISSLIIAARQHKDDKKKRMGGSKGRERVKERLKDMKESTQKCERKSKA